MRDGPAVDKHFVEDQRASDRVQPDGGGPDATEKVTLIEFMWRGLRGAQPVIFVAREWLQ